ncbi:Endonuclease/exonuclease/phosphatase [Xylariomycetidae sp. FL2044]|nr:Endonuclease/exonuclease/phosphatase [Xylariomycetidae sp. FL2044]
MEQLPVELNFITLNCWGLPRISPHRAERLTAIGRHLAAIDPSPQIVALQEVWTQADYRSIRRESRFVLPYGKFYHSGIFGSGLVILSKWPIEESSMHPYPLNGRPTAFFRGDWYVGKGVASARIRYGTAEKDVVEVFNTHTHAIYEHSPKIDSYQVHHLSQAWELAKLVRGAAERGHLAVTLGDFNNVPQSLPYQILTAHAPVRDAWLVLNPDSSLGSAEHDVERSRRRPIPTAAFNVAENGVTSNSVYNTWTWSKKDQKVLRSGQNPMMVPPDTLDPRGQRIDYIFFSRGPSPPSPLPLNVESRVKDESGGPSTGMAPASGLTGWVVKDVRVGSLSRHPELHCSLSDHFSVEATLLLHTPSTSPNDYIHNLQAPNAYRPDTSTSSRSITSTEAGLHPQARAAAVTGGTYLQSPNVSELRISGGNRAYDSQLMRDSMSSPAPNYPNLVGGEGLPCSSYDEILTIIHTYMRRTQTQKQYRLWHFITWCVVVVVCYVAVWFLPYNGIAFAFLVLSSIGFMAGTIDGLLAILFFGGQEMGALKEFEWEMMNARASASGAGGLVVQEDEKTW